jgi:hypothetical protein
MLEKVATGAMIVAFFGAVLVFGPLEGRGYDIAGYTIGLPAALTEVIVSLYIGAARLSNWLTRRR